MAAIGAALVLALTIAGVWFLTRDSGDDAAQNTADPGSSAQPTTQGADEPAQTDAPDEPADPTEPPGKGPLEVEADFVNQPCSNALVVVLASSGTPSEYEAAIGRAVQSVPDAKYLRTDRSCATFNQAVDGKPIYAAYVGPFSSIDDACQARIETGLAQSYVRALALNRSSREICSCEDSPDVLPRLSVRTASDPSYEVRLRVVDLQAMLYSAGYNDANVLTGSFGRETATMVRAFQRRNRLAVDGWVGPETWGALLSTECR